MFLASGEGLRAMTPAQRQTEIARRFQREDQVIKMHDAPAFDLVRASVNLAVASVLIAIATSLKLPLSTTFVSFMVAMGASLADRAWGRDSAAYRVAGVLSAFQGIALVGLLVLVGVALYHTFRYHATRSHRDERVHAKDATVFAHQIQLLQSQMADLVRDCSNAVDLSIRGLLEGDRTLLNQAESQVKDLQQGCRRKELIFVRVLKRVQPQVDERLLGHLEVLACQQDLYQSVALIVKTTRAHVFNAHEHLTDQPEEALRRFNELQKKTVAAQIDAWSTGREDSRITGFIEDLDTLLTAATHSAVSDLYTNVRPVKFTTLLLTLLTELADYVREIERAHSLWDNYIRLTETMPAAGPLPEPLPDVT